MLRLNKEMCVKGSTIVFVPQDPQMFVLKLYSRLNCG